MAVKALSTQSMQGRKYANVRDSIVICYMPVHPQRNNLWRNNWAPSSRYNSLWLGRNYHGCCYEMLQPSITAAYPAQFTLISTSLVSLSECIEYFRSYLRCRCNLSHYHHSRRCTEYMDPRLVSGDHCRTYCFHYNNFVIWDHYNYPQSYGHRLSIRMLQ